MSTLIRQIDQHSVHQIQSGQVINDGLTSAVKELVENSIDAGATSIDIRFKNHGLESIEVSDNGEGISAENYDSLALKHYTSKLREYSDLETVKTFGFRGEALSSLCALSDLQITTATAADAPKGVKLEFETSGHIKSQSVAASSKGTTVSVGKLFRYLPVRRKELERNIKRDYAKVLSVLQAYACVSVGVKFSVSNLPLKGKRTPVFATRANNTSGENLCNIFGTKTFAALIPLDLHFKLKESNQSVLKKTLTFKSTEDRKVAIVGYVSRPVVGEGRNAPDRQMFFINGRPCNLPQVAKAFNEVYKGFNATQSPFICADLRLDTDAYDVNVSPDKRTILLHNQQALLESLKISLGTLFGSHEQTMPVNQLSSQSNNSLSRDIFQSKVYSSAATSESPGCQPTSHLTPHKETANPDLNSEYPPTREDDEDEETSEETNTSDENIGSQETDNESSKFLQIKPPSKENEPLNTGSPVAPSVSSEAGNKETSSQYDGFLGSQDHKHRTTSINNPTTTIMIGNRSPILSGLVLAYPQIKRRKIDSVQERNFDSSKLSFSKFKAPSFTPGSRGVKRPSAHDVESEPESEHDLSSISNAQNDPPDSIYLDDVDTDDPQLIAEEQDELGMVKKPLLRDEDFIPSQSSTSSECGTLNVSNDEIILEPRPNIERTDVRGRLNGTEENTPEESSISNEKLLERACMLLKGSSKKTTKPYMRRYRTSILEIKQLSQNLKKDLSGGSQHLHQNGDILNQNDQESEERLNLTVKKQDFLQMDVKGQFNRGFIIARREDELFIIDQHASDEKYNFEMLQANTIIQNQPLVVGRPLDLMAMDEVVVMEHLDVLKTNGFQVDVNSEKPVGMRCTLVSLPMSKETVFGVEDLQELIYLIHQTQGTPGHIRCSKARSMFAMRACRMSIMVGRALPHKSMEKVVRNMASLDKPWNCPHGRPTMRHLFDLGSVRAWSEYLGENGYQWEGTGWQDVREDYSNSDDNML